MKSADQVALEAGNSPSIILKHYRELITPEIAEKWFGIMSKQGQLGKTLSYDDLDDDRILNLDYTWSKERTQITPQQIESRSRAGELRR